MANRNEKKWGKVKQGKTSSMTRRPRFFVFLALIIILGFSLARSARAEGDQLQGDQLQGDQLQGDQATGDQLQGDQLQGDQAAGDQAEGD